jgi:hypothetical protein
LEKVVASGCQGAAEIAQQDELLQTEGSGHRSSHLASGRGADATLRLRAA